MTTTITHNNSRTARTYPTRAAALAALRETYGDEIATYDCDGEPGRALVWASQSAMDADKSGGGSAVAEISESTTLTLYVRRDGAADDGRIGTLADAVELATAEECEVIGYAGDVLDSEDAHPVCLRVAADGSHRWL